LPDCAAPGGEKYETPEWALQGYAGETLPVMDKVHARLQQGVWYKLQVPIATEIRKLAVNYYD